MNLNLPDLDQLSSCQNILIAGMGGGFDVFCGLPIYFELQRRGHNVRLANLSFSGVSFNRLKDGVALTDTLMGVGGGHTGVFLYFPDLYLSRWFRETRGEEVTIWCFQGRSVHSLISDYRTLIQHLSIDAILLIDGGVDSLIRGDEAQTGTLLEDSVSLCAVDELENAGVRLLTCLGFGAEGDLTYAHVLENVAALAEQGAFYGSCSLVHGMEAYQQYEDAVTYVHSQRLQSPSVINASIISAVRGRFGNYHLLEKTKGSRLWISPLMPVYWFFDLPAVAERNLTLPYLRNTYIFGEAMQGVMACRSQHPVRPHVRIPLT